MLNEAVNRSQFFQRGMLPVEQSFARGDQMKNERDGLPGGNKSFPYQAANLLRIIPLVVYDAELTGNCATISS